ncbi:MAG: carbon-nitrogen hydrolase family protein [Thermoplasmatales archaeon]|nr:carbon-nitrogen hydrolase family protein [Thermoplasmatales archaeon]MCK4995747.1 carbon-nitrogen hydrolase family protein [Thermoplasmatales archaeon]
MKVAIITMRPKIANKKANLETMKKHIEKIKADMYIFGELTICGYNAKDEMRDIAETINAPSVKFVKELAKKHKCYIVFGMPLKDSTVRGIINNSSILIHPSGKVDFYNKWFLPTVGPFEEKIFFDEGEELTLCDTKFGKIGLIVCYDIFFPELCRAYALMGADIIICLSATPSVTRKYFETLIPARAIENTVFFIYVNLVGTQENMIFWGGSEIRDPLSNQILKAPYFKESVKVCEIDLKQVEFARANRPVLRDIKSEIYNDLYSLSRTHKLDTKK